MSIPTTEARVLVCFDNEEDRFLPEGPRSVVVNGREALAWVNIQTAAASAYGTIHLRFWDDGECRTLRQPFRPGFVLPTNRPGVVVVGGDKKIGRLDLHTNALTIWVSIPDLNPRTIINDGEVVPGGRAIVFGTKDLNFAEPIGHLYLLTLHDLKISILADGQTCSNGKVLKQIDGDLCLFDIDTPRRNVVRYRLDVDKRGLESGTPCLNLSNAEGFPDGMVAGTGDSVVIAFYNPARGGNGHALQYSTTSGAVIEEWTTPDSPRVTCPLLVELDGKIQLVLTTAVEGMPAEQRGLSTNAGNVFIAKTRLQSLPENGTVQLLEF